MFYESLTENLAMAAGAVAFVSLVSWPLFKDRRTILLLQLMVGLSFASHYALLGITAAAVVNILGSVQTTAAIFADDSPAMRKLGYGLIALMIAAGLAFWTGPLSALCVIAMGLIAVGRMQSDPLKLRLICMSGGAFWMVHDFLAESWIAFSADTASLMIAIISLVRMRTEFRAFTLQPAAT